MKLLKHDYYNYNHNAHSDSFNNICKTEKQLNILGHIHDAKIKNKCLY